MRAKTSGARLDPPMPSTTTSRMPSRAPSRSDWPKRARSSVSVRMDSGSLSQPRRSVSSGTGSGRPERVVLGPEAAAEVLGLSSVRAAPAPPGHTAPAAAPARPARRLPPAPAHPAANHPARSSVLLPKRCPCKICKKAARGNLACYDPADEDASGETSAASWSCWRWLRRRVRPDGWPGPRRGQGASYTVRGQVRQLPDPAQPGSGLYILPRGDRRLRQPRTAGDRHGRHDHALPRGRRGLAGRRPARGSVEVKLHVDWEGRPEVADHRDPRAPAGHEARLPRRQATERTEQTRRS